MPDKKPERLLSLKKKSTPIHNGDGSNITLFESVDAFKLLKIYQNYDSIEELSRDKLSKDKKTAEKQMYNYLTRIDDGVVEASYSRKKKYGGRYTCH